MYADIPDMEGPVTGRVLATRETNDGQRLATMITLISGMKGVPLNPGEAR